MPAELQQRPDEQASGPAGRSSAGRRASEGQPGLPVYMDGPPMQPLHLR